MAITINNSANITYKYGTLTDSSSSNVATTLLAENYSLKASKISNNMNFRPSENLTFIIRVENDGAEPLFAVSVQDNLGGGTPNLLNYIAGSAKMYRDSVVVGIIPTNTAPLTFEIPDTVEPGEVIILSYVAKVRGDIANSINSIVNEATVVGHETSISGPVITVTPLPSVIIPKADYADVKITKSVDKENVNVGDKLTYTFRLENSGNALATNVVITDNLPEKYVIESVIAVTGGVTTTFEATDYSLDASNKLILPISAVKTISVPAKTINANGLTVVTIVGTVIA